MALQLPSEILLSIASSCPRLKDVNALARTCWRCYQPLGWYLYERDSKSETSVALVWAARHGVEETAKKALAAVADPGMRFSDTTLANSPLHCAAGNGHEAVLRLLLAVKGVDPNSQCRHDRLTPLVHAADNGHLHIVKYLAGLDTIDLSLGDLYNFSLLWYAVHGGSTEVVKFLMTLDSVLHNLDPPPSSERYHYPSAFLLAVQRGHADMVELFLADGVVDPDQRGWDNESPLWIAASKGHAQVVKLLMDTGRVDLNCIDTNYRRTPFLMASLRDRFEVVSVLLSNDGVDVNAMGRTGTTALYSAVAGRQIGMVRMLLESGRVDPNVLCCHDPDHETALTKAIEGGHLGIIDMLLATEGIRVNEPSWGRCPSPLLVAVSADHNGTLRPHRMTIINRLLDLEQIDANQPDIKGITPLVCAIESRYGAAAAETLLSSKKVDPNKKDHRGQTPLIHAASKGDVAMVKLLLNSGRVDANMRGNDGASALSIAAKTGNCSMIRVLLEWPHTDPEIRGEDGLTPFALAAYYEWQFAANLLLRTGKVDINSKDRSGRSPLSLAASLGYCEMADWLLSEGAAVTKPGYKGRWPSLSWVVSRCKDWASPTK